MFDVSGVVGAFKSFAVALVVAMVCGAIVAFLARNRPKRTRIALMNLTFMSVAIVGFLIVTARLAGV